MNGRRLLVLPVLAIALACEDQKMPTEPVRIAPADPSAIISDGAHCGPANTPPACNPDFFFLPPMVPLALGNPNFELGKFNNALKSNLKITICQLKPLNLNGQGLPTGNTPCVEGDPLKTFAPPSIKVVNLPLRENGWWNLFGLPPDGFYYVLWDTQKSKLNVNKFYRIRVFINAGGPDVLLGVADVDPMSNLREWKFSRTGEVIQMIDDVMLPIPFRVERSKLCNGASLCASGTIENNPADGEDQFVRVQGADGSYIAGVRIPAGFLPPPPGPQTVILTITRVNTGINNPLNGTQTIPCHGNLHLQQFNSCFNFSTIPALPTIAGTDGRQFLKAITVAVCFVLQEDEDDTRVPYVQLFSSDPGEEAKPLDTDYDTEILSGPGGRSCGDNLNVGFNKSSNGFTRFASAGWQKVKGGLGRVFGVQTAYAVDLGLGGLTFDLSNIGPAMNAQMSSGEFYPNVSVNPGETTRLQARIVGTRVHDGSALGTGIPYLPVKFEIGAANAGSLRLVDSEAPAASNVEDTTSFGIYYPGSAGSGGGFVEADWTAPMTPGPYTVKATSPYAKGEVTFQLTVRPPEIIGFNGWSILAGHNGYTCGLARDGPAYCWGGNGVGSLGDGSTTSRTTPVAVTGGITFASLRESEGYTPCGLTGAGAAFCWGYNLSGQVGDGSTTNRSTPVSVAGGLTFAILGGGQMHSCGLTQAGAAYCWGRNDWGQLGDGTTTDRATPVAVAGGLAFAKLAAGVSHTCALTLLGAAYCWGSNTVGALGNGSEISMSTTPVAVAGELRFESLTAGYGHNCGVTSGGAAHCWGYNAFGQLGDGSTTNYNTPVAVAGELTFSSVTAGGHHTCALRSGGAAYCWGSGGGGTTPTAVTGEITFASLTAGVSHACGLTSSGAAYCWGGNPSGELGDGTRIDRGTPVRVLDP